MTNSVQPQTSVISHNITEQMEEIESLDFIQKNKKKYSGRQFSCIQNALDRMDEKIRVVSFNILFSLNDHYLNKKHQWPNRKVAVIESIHQMDPDILAVQEPLDDQVEELQGELAGYEYFGVHENTSMNQGIFFKKDRFECVEKKAFHLESDDERFESVVQDPNWESKRKGLAYVKLMDKKTAKIVHVFNAHLSFFNPNWREMDATVMHDTATKILEEDAKKLNYQPAAILVGDWNTFDNRPDMNSLPFYDGTWARNIVMGDEFQEAQKNALLGYIGPLSTFTNDPDDTKVKPFRGLGNPGIILDNIVISKKVLPILQGINPIQVNGEFPSDHMPVVLDFLID